MLDYKIQEAINARIIIVSIRDLQRFALHDITDTPLQFKPISKTKTLAICTTLIKIYKKPTTLDFHKEYMLQNARTLWHSASMADSELITRNLYELIEKV